MTRGRVTLTERKGYGRRRKYIIDVFRVVQCHAEHVLGGRHAEPHHVREFRQEQVEQTRRPAYATTTVTQPHRSGSAVRYSSKGPLRGRCGHYHRHLDDALECLAADDAWCIARGGRTDRTLYAVVTPRNWRPLNADEVAAVELYRRTLAKTQT